MYSGKIVEKDPLFICIFFCKIRSKQIAIYNDKRDISLIIAIYMTQARICTKGLNPLVLRTRNKHMSRRLHVISWQDEGEGGIVSWT